jgi:HD-GYP domain-containing protein (c-di-GMP phosphodiesterase class II)
MGSFWVVQRFVQSTVRQGLETSLREQQLAMAAVHPRLELQNSRFLRVAGENSALKAGIQLLLTHPRNQNAQRTVEDQLRELGEHMGFDFMRVSAPGGAPLAAVLRDAAPSGARGELTPADVTHLDRSGGGILRLGDRMIEVASVPIDQDDSNMAVLSVGQFFNLSDLSGLVVLMRGDKVVEANLPNISPDGIEHALSGCTAGAECDLTLAGSQWISLPLQSFGNEYRLLSFANVDAATAPIQWRLRKLFLSLASLLVVVALLSSFGASSSIVKPIAVIVAHLRQAVSTGKLTELEAKPAAIVEIDELAAIYNRAAISVRQAGDQLESAYLEFVSSLAHALDARDPYTAGHSQRVSHVACAIAVTLNLPAEEVERIRIGALLHDIGKIGITDTVLQKPGRLTREEYELVKQHPVIGRRILEAVQGFAPYLAAVELHHENWNGTGYPHRQKGEETPIEARIIHVSDAYDAMTTNRSYRRCMSYEEAATELMQFAGIQFDPRVVQAFLRLPSESLAQTGPNDIVELPRAAEAVVS